MTSGKQTAKESTIDFQMPRGDSSFARRVRSEMSDPARLKDFAALRSRLRDAWVSDFDDDLYLYRFFKAREFDTGKAEEMVRNHLRWRREFRADELLVKGLEEPEVLKRYYPGGFCGYDKEGRPVWYEASGLVDPQGIAKSVPRDQLLRSRVYICEKFVRQTLPELRKRTGEPVYSCTFIVDLHKYGRRHLWGPGLEFYAEFVRICEQNYPETIGAAYIVNAPAIFPVAYNILKPLLHPETQKKVKLLGKNYQQVLLEVIDADQVPQVYGGNLRDPVNGDPRCPSLICWGGEVPLSYYLRPNYPDRLASQHIGRRAKFHTEVSVPTAGRQCIEWDFLTEDGDLGFEIRDSVNPEREPLVGYRRVHCGICPCSGAVACPQPGVYTVHFDNSFSWVHSKRLRYFVHATEKPLAPLLDADVCRQAGFDSETADAEAEEFERNLEALMHSQPPGLSEGAATGQDD